jgi:hypothetical protein
VEGLPEDPEEVREAEADATTGGATRGQVEANSVPLTPSARERLRIQTYTRKNLDRFGLRKRQFHSMRCYLPTQRTSYIALLQESAVGELRPYRKEW